MNYRNGAAKDDQSAAMRPRPTKKFPDRGFNDGLCNLSGQRAHSLGITISVHQMYKCTWNFGCCGRKFDRSIKNARVLFNDFTRDCLNRACGVIRSIFCKIVIRIKKIEIFIMKIYEICANKIWYNGLNFQ